MGSAHDAERSLDEAWDKYDASFPGEEDYPDDSTITDWVTAAGDALLLTEMTESHLTNTVKFLGRRIDELLKAGSSTDAPDDIDQDRIARDLDRFKRTIEAMNKELEGRNGIPETVVSPPTNQTLE